MMGQGIWPESVYTFLGDQVAVRKYGWVKARDDQNPWKNWLYVGKIYTPAKSQRVIGEPIRREYSFAWRIIVEKAEPVGRKLDI